MDNFDKALILVGKRDFTMDEFYEVVKELSEMDGPNYVVLHTYAQLTEILLKRLHSDKQLHADFLSTYEGNEYVTAMTDKYMDTLGEWNTKLGT